MTAESVLSLYPPPVAGARWTPLGRAGGFSGSRVWRGEATDGRAFALKAYPPDADAGRLAQVHRWMSAARTAGLDVVPTVEPCRDRRTVAVSGGVVWDVTTWMPGRADFHAEPTDAKLLAAVEAVARIHAAWADPRATGVPPREGPCPAVERRWRVLNTWQELVRSGWRPRFEPGDPVRPHAEAAWDRLPRVLPDLLPRLAAWLGRRVPLQPCLGDLWHDHILFAGDRVAAVIDYGAAKLDHPAADLARLLGSLIPDDARRTAVALGAYSALRPLPHPELVDVLDRTGTAAAAANWLRRLYRDREAVDRAAVAQRLAGLVRRLTKAP